jgi:predicted O-methyltransferase YrrM
VKAKNQQSIQLFEDLRKGLLNDNSEITIKDLGAGSPHSAGFKRKISNIAKTSLTPPKFSALYNRIINRYDAQTIIELGTSLGINTLYLAQKAGTRVTTFEGSPAIALNAKLTFEFVEAQNIKLIEGNIDQTLPAFLEFIRKIDLAFIDANHSYKPTIKYFNWLITKTHPRSIIIIDDIHYTKEMQNAWNEIKHHPLVYGSADLYRCGIIFLDPSLNKQHVVLQF